MRCLGDGKLSTDRLPRQGGKPMPFPSDSFDAETVALMQKAFDEAWEEIGFALARDDFDPSAVRALMALRIMTAVRDGVRDPEQLKELALTAIKDAY